MDESAIERAKQRVAERADGAALQRLVARAHEQVEALSQTAAALEERIPAHVEASVRDQAQPVARNLAEVRGLMNQVLSRLQRLEDDALAERHARVDDLALLVELVSAGWANVDERLARLEQGIQESRGAIVYRMEDRRPDAATS